MKEDEIVQRSEIKLNRAQNVPDASLTFTLTEQFDWCLSHLNYEAILRLLIFLAFHLKFARIKPRRSRQWKMFKGIKHMLRRVDSPFVQ